LSKITLGGAGMFQRAIGKTVKQRIEEPRRFIQVLTGPRLLFPQRLCSRIHLAVFAKNDQANLTLAETKMLGNAATNAGPQIWGVKYGADSF
jgi:hypothetical protein